MTRNEEASIVARLEEAAKGVLSSHNLVRQRSEEVLNDLKQNPTLLLSPLLHLIVHSADENVKQFCAVLLRQLIEGCAGNAAAVAIRPILLQILAGAQDSMPVTAVYKRIIDVVVALATCKSGSVSAASEWKELLPSVWQMVQSTSSAQHQAALTIIDRLAEFDFACLRPNLQDILHLLLQILGSAAASSDARVAALRACISVLVSLEEHECVAFAGSGLMPLMLQAVQRSEDEATVRDVLTSLVELVACKGHLFTGILPSVCETMGQVARSANLEPDTRYLALELLISLCESGPEVRNNQQLPATAVPIALELLLDVPAKEWEEMEHGEDGVWHIGANAIQRITSGIGAQAMLNVLAPTLSVWCASDAWQQRQAALLVLASMGQDMLGSFPEPELLNLIEQWTSVVTHALVHPVDRVRFAALELCCVMASRLELKFQNGAGSDMLAGIAPLLLDSCVSVSEKAAEAVYEYAGSLAEEDEEGHPLQGHEQVLQALATLIVSRRASPHSPTHLGTCLTAIAALAQALGERFVPFYASFMPAVLGLISDSSTSATERGKAIEAAGFIGVAVGKERFTSDGVTLVRSMLAFGVTSEHEEYGYVQQTLARVAGCIGEPFLPFLPSIIPALLRSAALEDGCSVEEIYDDSPADTESGIDFVDVHVRGLGRRRIRLNTSVLEEKAMAANMLYQYAHDFGTSFTPFVPQCVEVLLPLVRCRYNEQVRLAAAAALPVFVSALEVSTPAEAMALARLSVPALVDAIGVEPELPALLLLVECIVQLVDAVPSPLEIELVEKLAVALRVLMDEAESRSADRTQRLLSPHADLQEKNSVDEELAADAELRTHIVDCIQKMSRSNGAAFIPVFQRRLEEPFANFFKGNHSDNEVVAALCAFDEVLENCGDAGVSRYLPVMMPIFLRHAVSTNSELRQSAVYGLGVSAQVAGDAFHAHLDATLETVLRLCFSDDARSEEMLLATDNAISAFGKLLRYHSRRVNMTELLPRFLSLLPCSSDEIEANVIHETFVYFLQQSPELMAVGSPVFDSVLYTMASVIVDNLASEQTLEALKRLWVERIRSQLNSTQVAERLTKREMKHEKITQLLL